MNFTPTRRRLLATFATFAVVATACGDAAPAANTTSAAPTTTAVAPDTTVTVDPAPDTTVAPTTSNTTTTTTEPPITTSGVIVGLEGVLGWWDGTDWRSLDDGEPPAVEGDTYQVLQIGEETTTRLGGPLTSGCEFIEGSRAVEVGISVDAWPQATPIAVSSETDLVPHSVELLPTPPTVYSGIVSTLLANRGIVDPNPSLVQVIRTDLEGDGVDEILIAAERNATGSLNPAAVDDYSILLLRKIVQGEVQTAIISFVSVDPPVVEGSIIALDTLRFTTVADFNGDEKMEIAYTSQYYEGSSTHLVEYVNDDLGTVEVLAVGCGV